MSIVGLHHLDLAVADPAPSLLGREVHLGTQVEAAGVEGEDRDEPGHWAFFVFDPDGFRGEVAHWRRELGAGTDSACA